MFSGKVLSDVLRGRRVFVAFRVEWNRSIWWAHFGRRKERPPRNSNCRAGRAKHYVARVQKPTKTFSFSLPRGVAPCSLLERARNCCTSPKNVCSTGRRFCLLVFAGSLIAQDPCYSAFFTAAGMTSSGIPRGKTGFGISGAGLSAKVPVFHDVPAEGRPKEINLDQVTVGPGPASRWWKRRRGERKRTGGRPEHEVTSDGIA